MKLRSNIFIAPLSALLLVFLTASTTWTNHGHPLATSASSIDNPNLIKQMDGLSSFNEGKRLFDLMQYDEAVAYFWKSVLAFNTDSDGGKLYSLHDCFSFFMRCFSIRGKLIDGYIYVAREAFKGNQIDMARTYVMQANEIDPDHEEVKALREMLQNGYKNAQEMKASSTSKSDNDRAAELYSAGNNFFQQKQFQRAINAFEESCSLGAGNPVFRVACINAVYCRTNINDWGPNGTQFEKDMELIADVTKMEIADYRISDEGNGVKWRRALSVNPHMMLGYPVEPSLKRFVSESHASTEEMTMRLNPDTGKISQMPLGLPYDNEARREAFKESTENDPNFKIRIGFVSSGISSKAVLYLSQDMFRFFDKDKFEVHIFSVGAADSPQFIQHGMNGVDWRQRVKDNVDYFHDVEHLKDDHIKLAMMVHDLDMHFMIEWDGYARQGSRAQGLLALRPAPIQILHQEYLGTYGGDFIDYIITDKIASPMEVEDLYVEKFMYMPNHFFSKGHAVQAEVDPPTYDYQPAQNPYVIGTGSPQENRCLSPSNVGPEHVSFVYCNFNKFLKNNPETVRSWIEVLRNVPDSIICLLENPKDGIENLRRFVNDAASSSNINDGDDLNSRIHFLPWAMNPFDHQKRNRDFCNAVLDNYPYNGHTTAQDALYGGVPIVTRSDGIDMSSLVSTSANSVLGMEELNAKEGIPQYVKIATKLGNDPTYFKNVRNKLIGTCLQKNPMHPYWDVERYVANFQQALTFAWLTYLSGNSTEHITVVEGLTNGEDAHSEL